MNLFEKVQNLFGLELPKKNKKEFVSFVHPENDDGSLIINQTGGFAEGGIQSIFLNLNSTATTEFELIKEYRVMAMNPEIEVALDDIINEAIITGEQKDPVSIAVDLLEDVSDPIKEKISNAFDEILKLLNFNKIGDDIFKKWYVDGRLYHHIVIDENNLSKGIQKIIPIDSLSIKKIKIVKKDIKNIGTQNIDVVAEIEDFFQYTSTDNFGVSSIQVNVAPDAISYIHSGLLDENRKFIVSNLHKAIKPLNQLTATEDAVVIYRLTRAPERRVFYIDVGNLPKGKAEQYVNNIMLKYKNKLVYDSVTGQIQDKRNHMAMQEDFFLPRREGGKGTEIQTLPSGQNLGETADVEYFKRKLMKSLNVPASRLESETAFNIGRSAEITRDEVKFSKFISKLRHRFSALFNNLLKTQLILKKVIVEKEWESYKEKIHYNWIKDSHFTELKDAEILRERLSLINDIDTFAGKYYSLEWIKKNVLKMTEQQINDISKQIKKEQKSGEVPEAGDFKIAQLGLPPEPPPEEEEEVEEVEEETPEKEES